MRTRTAQWYLVKAHYGKTMEDGTQKNVTEQYVADAMSCGEAECRVTEETSHYASGGSEITDINRAKYNEIFFTDQGSDDKWYKAVLKFIAIDERTGKEKKTASHHLVQAASLAQARKNIEEAMSCTMIDYEVYSITETAIMGVLEYKGKTMTEGKEAG